MAVIGLRDRAVQKSAWPVKTRHNEVSPSRTYLPRGSRTPTSCHRSISEDDGDAQAALRRSTSGRVFARTVLGGRETDRASTSTVDERRRGNDLLGHGANPHEEHSFPRVLHGRIRAVNHGQGCCAPASRSAGHDHRLVAKNRRRRFCRSSRRHLTDIFEHIEQGGAKVEQSTAASWTPAPSCFPTPAGPGDRNRTSPSRSTGNNRVPERGRRTIDRYPNIALNVAVTASWITSRPAGLRSRAQEAVAAVARAAAER